MSPEQLQDILDCGNAQEAWQEMVAHFKQRARQEREIAADLEREAKDAFNRCTEHREIAAGFDVLAVALINADVDFPKSEKAA
jgi:hypothetical protein